MIKFFLTFFCQVCPKGWLKIGTNKCIFSTGLKKNHSDANDLCTGLKLDLLSIKTREEQKDIEFWIEKHDIKDEIWLAAIWLSKNAIMWTDGTILDYQNFAVGQPDNYGQEMCIELRPDWRGEWNDHVCSIEKMVICQREIKKQYDYEGNFEKLIQKLSIQSNDLENLKTGLNEKIESINEYMISIKSDLKTYELKLQSVENKLESTKLTLIENGKLLIEALKHGLNQHFNDVWDKFDSILKYMKN